MVNKRALLFASVAVIIWASAFTGVRASLLGGYTPGHLALVRCLLASAVFILYYFIPGVRFKLPKKEDIIRILFLGWLGISAYHICLTFGIQTITAGTASMILGATPVFTAIIAVIFLKEKMELFGWIGLSIGFIGIVVITIGSSGPDVSISGGSLLVLVATIATAVFFVFQRPLFANYHPIDLTAYFTWAGTLPMFIFFPGLTESIKASTTEAHIAALFVGVFPAAIAYAIWAMALSLGSASTVTTMLYVEPAIAIVIALLWLREWPNTLSLIGGAIAITSVFIVNIIGRKRQRQKSQPVEDFN